ncbi:MAG: hypothetical protein H7Z75_15415 [Ferruginibacter sp.]|nr:hypothetical protein [Cytophagales bacterium]
MNAIRIGQGLSVGLLISLVGCRSNESEPVNPAETASFDLLQDRMLTTSCATPGCHASESDATFKQHGLVLTKGSAYPNLVHVLSRNPSALADGLRRVQPYQSESSLLYHKLAPDASTHHGGKNYGSPMPLGGQPLPAGQIEFVRRWIEAGAPATGSVVDATLLDDQTPGTPIAFEPLAPPPVGTGYQVKLDRFAVNPDFEREVFVHRAIGNPSEMYVNRIVLRSRPNSHHMVLYDFRDRAVLPPLDQVRDLRNPDNTLNRPTTLTMANHLFLGGGTQANQDYTLPAGTALKFPANHSIDLNAHYFNKTRTVLYGENYVNLYTTDPAKVQKIVQELDLGNQSLEITANQRKTFTKSWTFDQPRHVIMLTSHNHRLGEKFIIRIRGGTRDGQVVYESTDWEHPVVKNFTPALVLDKGEGLTSEITYYNPTDRTVRFGLTSDDEMGIIFGYYYED